MEEKQQGSGVGQSGETVTLRDVLEKFSQVLVMFEQMRDEIRAGHEAVDAAKVELRREFTPRLEVFERRIDIMEYVARQFERDHEESRKHLRVLTEGIHGLARELQEHQIESKQLKRRLERLAARARRLEKKAKAGDSPN